MFNENKINNVKKKLIVQEKICHNLPYFYHIFWFTIVSSLITDKMLVSNETKWDQLFAIWLKMHFFAEWQQQQLALNHRYSGRLRSNLVGKYTGMVWKSMYIIKLLLVIFLSIVPKIHFYSFLLISRWLIDQFEWKFAC